MKKEINGTTRIGHKLQEIPRDMVKSLQEIRSRNELHKLI